MAVPANDFQFQLAPLRQLLKFAFAMLLLATLPDAIHAQSITANADPPPPAAVVRAPSTDSTGDEQTSIWDRISLRGYGTVNYFAFDWDTDSGRRNQLDLERLVLYPGVQLTPSIRLEAEVEFEHGGTGVTLEFDRFEEFGEFEQEVEAGGEVLLEQMYVDLAIHEAFGLRFGRFKIPIGLQAPHDEPAEYFTTTWSATESNLIPVNWYEIGVQAYGSTGGAHPLRYTLSVVNGLDATGFSSATWVVRGHQKRFESVNADNLAVTARVAWDAMDDVEIGASGYIGNSSGNRPKPDLDVDAYVSVVSGHVLVERGPVTARSLVLYGRLQNADAVSRANRNLSNFLNVKRTPVGSAALGYYVEGGVDVLYPFDVDPIRLVPFVRWERYDSMYRVSGDVLDNPRWERTVTTVGVNFHIAPELVFKGQYSHRVLGISEANVENTLSVGLGFEFR